MTRPADPDGRSGLRRSGHCGEEGDGGGSDDVLEVQVPAALYEVWRTRRDWNYATDPQRAKALETLESLYRPVSSCRMGTDDQSVIDPQMRVHGIDGLRVIDASVMPTLVRGNTNAPTIMTAERGADLVGQSVGAGTAVAQV
jgi:choline dehydrogenase-like flavoprotein